MHTAVGPIVKIKVDLTYLKSLLFSQSFFSSFFFHLALLNNLFSEIKKIILWSNIKLMAVYNA